MQSSSPFPQPLLTAVHNLTLFETVCEIPADCRSSSRPEVSHRHEQSIDNNTSTITMMRLIQSGALTVRGTLSFGETIDLKVDPGVAFPLTGKMTRILTAGEKTFVHEYDGSLSSERQPFGDAVVFTGRYTYPGGSRVLKSFPLMYPADTTLTGHVIVPVKLDVPAVDDQGETITPAELLLPIIGAKVAVARIEQSEPFVVMMAVTDPHKFYALSHKVSVFRKKMPHPHEIDDPKAVVTDSIVVQQLMRGSVDFYKENKYLVGDSNVRFAAAPPEDLWLVFRVTDLLSPVSLPV